MWHIMKTLPTKIVQQVFTASRHRLCMWYIMRKLPTKISGDLLRNTNVRACIHRLVWNVYIKQSTFETRWADLLETFALDENQCLKEMHEIRERWAPAYFRDIPMYCLIKTTHAARAQMHPLCKSQIRSIQRYHNEFN
ncbi:putative FHY3/FAR1 family protein [Helianthus annuus]|nr:putative FHY3/FAR1 family protein [Helianthus annuus]